MAGPSPSRTEAPAPEDPAGPTFELFRERFREAAEAAGGAEDRFIEIAGVSVRLSFAGPELLEVYWSSFEPPLRAAGPGGAEVTVEIFDSASTGAAAPRLAWRHEDPEPDHVARYDGPEVGALQEFGCPALTIARPESGVAVHHVPSAQSVSWIERGSAFRFAMASLLGPRGRHLVHGAAVGEGGAGVLLAGPSGAGKSTLSVACLQAGLQWAGDDYVVLEPGEPPVAHALHVTAKLSPASVDALGVGELVVGEASPPDEKAVLLMPGIDPLVVTGLAIGAVLIPRIGPAPGLSEASAAQSFAALAPTTMFQQTSRSRASMAAIGALTKQVPARFIDLGPDHAENAATVREALLEF